MGEVNKESKKALDKEVKVRIKVPIDPQNPEDKVVPVTINGYRYEIVRGETIEVPNAVADVLANAHYI